MLNHISIGCSNLAKSTSFYDGVLAPLGYRRVCQGATFSGYGVVSQEDQFSVKQRDTISAPGAGFHIAFTAPDRRAVQEFYAQALRLGGRDHGEPGLRLNYGPTYYAAYVLDLDGYVIEAVCHVAE